MTAIEQVYRLQKIDKTLKEIELAQLDQTELKRLVQLKKEEQDLEVRVGQLEWRMRNIKRQVSQGELEIADVVERIDKNEERLYDGTIQNSKELEHLKSNIDNLRLQQSEIEETVIEVMEEIETIEKNLIELKQYHQDLKTECENLETQFKERLYKLRSNERRLRGKREIIINMLPDELYQHYLKLHNRYDGLAVVRIRGMVCTGCQVSLPKVVIDKVKQSTTPVHCEFCGRMLYYKQK